MNIRQIMSSPFEEKYIIPAESAKLTLRFSRFEIMSLNTLIDELNPQQKKAATTDAQHCLVLAGAGCGP